MKALRFAAALAVALVIPIALGFGQPLAEYKLHVLSASNMGLRVQTDSAGGDVASFGGYGQFEIDAPGAPGGRVTVKESGNVGIGTASPDQLVTVNSANAATNSVVSFKQGGTTAAYVGLGTDARLRVEAVTGTELRLQADGSSNPMTFYQNSSERIRIDTTGNVGIGTASPAEKLSVAGTVQSTSGGFKFPDGSVQATAATAASATYTTASTSLDGITTGPLASILHLNLPAGTYLLSATARYINFANFFAQDNSRLIQCQFSGDPLLYAVSLAGVGSLTTSVSTTFHSVLNISSGGVDLQCHGYNVNHNSVSVADRRLTAVTIAGNVIVQ